MSIFHHISSLIHARHIQCTLGPTISAQQSILDASTVLSEAAIDADYDAMTKISVVVSEDRPVGWIGFDSLNDRSKRVFEVVDRIEPDAIVSADTPALEVVKLFTENARHFYFVLDESRITGTIHYEDLFASPFRLCLFALALELETVALDLAQQNPADSWHALPKGRMEKAIDTYRSRYGAQADVERPPFDRLLACTMFVDKGTILKKRKLIPGSGADVDRVFRRGEKVRNACAHTEPEKGIVPVIRDRAGLNEFIGNTQEMIGLIRQALHASN